MFLPVQRASLILLFFLFTPPALTQFKYREIRHATDTNLVFPVFNHAGKTAEKSINDFLQMEFFETTIYQTAEQKLFDENRFFSEDSAWQSGYTSISYIIELNNSKILSLMFQVEYMGAYPTNYKRYFSFDSRSGKPVSVDTLFTKEGHNKIREILIKKRSEEIKKWTEELRRDIATDYAEDSSFIAQNFFECNAEANEKKMFISKDKILFYNEGCFPHAWGSYETNLDVSFTRKELEKYLSNFGKKLLFTK